MPSFSCTCSRSLQTLIAADKDKPSGQGWSDFFLRQTVAFQKPLSWTPDAQWAEWTSDPEMALDYL